MPDNQEKSCWGITLWASAVVIGLFVLTTLFSVSQKTAGAIPPLV